MPDKLFGYEFFKSIGSPKYIIAPMVDQSELAWRLLGRKYGAHLAFTPMFHAANFVRDPSYRREAMESSPIDRPLIYQFASNDARIFAEAAKLVENECEAVDLNLGCPQGIAKRGHYGSYLQNDWDLIREILTKAVREIKIPVTAKIRAQSSVELTVKYAKMIESCGVSMLTIHGRTRDQKGINTGLADWGVIKAVKNALSIPVIANGNIQYFPDIERCLLATGADGVMSAEGHLHNPAIFLPEHPPFVWDMALEYLGFARLHPCNISYSRGHVFKLLHHALHCHTHVRDLVSGAKHVDDLVDAVNQLKDNCGPNICQLELSSLSELQYKHWFCQPYIRPKTNVCKSDENNIDCICTNENNNPVGASENINLDNNNVIYPVISVNKLKEQRDEERRRKKEARQICKENKAKKRKIEALPCELCSCNMRGLKCEYNLCKTCCKKKRNNETRCIGHSQWKSNVSQVPDMIQHSEKM